MLTHTRNILRFSSLSRQSKNVFSSLGKSFSSVNASADFNYEVDVNTVVEQKQFSTVDLFENVFATQNSNNIYQAREGAVFDVSASDLKKYFPEGLAGEMDEEFEFVDSASWMIRDSSKLLCRILDEFVSTKGEKLGSLTIPKSIVTNVSIPTLTDRSEWDSAKISVKHFGTELSVSAETLSDNQTIAGEGSLVDSCINNLRQLTSEFPKNIIVTGTACYESMSFRI